METTHQRTYVAKTPFLSDRKPGDKAHCDGLYIFDYKQAQNADISSYNEILRANPDSLTALHERGNYYFDTEKYELAQRDYNRILDLCKKGAIYDGMYKLFGDLSDLNMVLDNTQAAIEYVNKSLECNPAFVVAWVTKAMCFVRLQRLDDAIKACERAIEYDPLYSDAYTELGYLYSRKNQTDRAIKYFTKGIECERRRYCFAPSLKYRYSEYLAQQMYREAISDLSEIVQYLLVMRYQSNTPIARPETLQHLFQSANDVMVDVDALDDETMSFTYAGPGEPAEVRLFNNSRPSDDSEANEIKAILSSTHLIEQLQACEVHYDIEDPDNNLTSVLIQRAQALDLFGYSDLAEKDLRLAFLFAESDKERATVHTHIAYMIQPMGFRKAALYRLSQAIELTPDSENTLADRLLYFYNHNMYSQAMEDANKILSINPRSTNVLNIRGLVHSVQGNNEAAVRDLQNAVLCEPTNQALKYNLAYCHFKAGQYERAIQIFDASDFDYNDRAIVELCEQELLHKYAPVQNDS